MEYRYAKFTDAYAITLMWRECFNEVKVTESAKEDNLDLEHFFYHVLERIRAENYITIVAIEDKNIVGFISGGIGHARHNTNYLVATCDYIYVKPEYRGKVGAELAKLGEQEARKLGVKKIDILTIYDTTLAKKWEAKGFTPTQIIYRKELTDEQGISKSESKS